MTIITIVRFYIVYFAILETVTINTYYQYNNMDTNNSTNSLFDVNHNNARDKSTVL